MQTCHACCSTRVWTFYFQIQRIALCACGTCNGACRLGKRAKKQTAIGSWLRTQNSTTSPRAMTMACAYLSWRRSARPVIVLDLSWYTCPRNSLSCTTWLARTSRFCVRSKPEANKFWTIFPAKSTTTCSTRAVTTFCSTLNKRAANLC